MNGRSIMFGFGLGMAFAATLIGLIDFIVRAL